MTSTADRTDLPTTAFTERHAAELDELGYTVVPGLLDDRQIEVMKAALVRIGNAEGSMAGHEYTACDDGSFRIHNLLEKDTAFDVCLTHPALLAAVRHVLGQDVRLSMLNMRSQLPGQKRQKLHVDWYDGAEPGGDFKVCNGIWALDDFTAENGATRVVPRSHRSATVPKQALEDRYADSDDDVRIFASAGDLIVFNSHLWHSGMDNRSDGPRAGVNAFFCRADQKPEMDQEALLSASTRARFTAEAREILGVDG